MEWPTAHGTHGAVIVESSSAAAADRVAALLGDRWPGDDTRLCEPEGARWRVAELVEQVVDPCSYAPNEHRNLVVADFHRSTPAVRDRLLKLLEENATATTFWLLTGEAEDLGATIRGRATHTVRLPEPGPADLAVLFADLDCETHVLEDAWKRTHGDPASVRALLKYQMSDQVAAVTCPLVGGHPNWRTGQFLLAAGTIALAATHTRKTAPAVPAGAGTSPVLDLKRLTPAHRVTVRKLIAAALDRWDTELDELAGRAGTRGQVAAVRATGATLAAARDGLAYNTNHTAIVTPVLTAGALLEQQFS